jgi:hypothetical protein
VILSNNIFPICFKEGGRGKKRNMLYMLKEIRQGPLKGKCSDNNMQMKSFNRL